MDPDTSDQTRPVQRGDKISIGGHVGSGKSSVARKVGDLTGWQLVSTGAIFREIAARHDLSVLELNEYARAHPEVDDEVDDYLRTLAATAEPVVIDSRMAFHFVPASFKCFLVVDPLIGAERIFAAGRDDERYDSVDDAAREAAARQRSEAERYEHLYGVNRDHWRNYDLVIDTSDTEPIPVARMVLGAFESDEPPRAAAPTCWLSPLNLIPTKGVPDAPAGDVPPDRAGPVSVAVYEGRFFIVGGHAGVSAALVRGETLIRCDLAAFEAEDVLPGVPAAHFARDAVSEPKLAGWETAHNIRLRDRPGWVH